MQPLPKSSAQKAVYSGPALPDIRPDRPPARPDNHAAIPEPTPRGGSLRDLGVRQKHLPELARAKGFI